VLHYEGGLLGMHDEALDDLGGRYALLTVEIGRGLVDLMEEGGREGKRTRVREGDGQ
jgi:hypothetical protein